MAAVTLADCTDSRRDAGLCTPARAAPGARALARQFLMQRGPIRHGPRRAGRRRGRRIQPGFQLVIVQILREWPGQPRRRDPIERFRHRAPRHPTTGRDLSVTEPTGPFESQHVVDLSHGHSLRWHRSLPHKMEGPRYPG